jgi:hypothetical protein
MVLGTPARHGRLVGLVQQQPLVAAPSVGPRADQDEAAGELLAHHVEVQLAASDRRRRVVGARW